jgi:hypothetical protein
MDYRFLNKVVEQIMSETTIDYDRKIVSNSSIALYLKFTNLLGSFFSSSYTYGFMIQCMDVYGLNEQEIEYVWRIYKDSIIYKVKEEKYRR